MGRKESHLDTERTSYGDKKMSYDQIMCVCGHDQEQHDWRHDWNGPCYFCECQKHREAAAHTPAEEAPTPATEMPLNQRLHDLVRHQRSALHVAGLISNEEYSELAQDHAAVKRLEDYDKVKAVTREECAQRLDALVKKWRDMIAEDIVRPRGSPRFVDCQDESVADCADTLAELAAAIRQGGKP